MKQYTLIISFFRDDDVCRRKSPFDVLMTFPFGLNQYKKFSLISFFLFISFSGTYMNVHERINVYLFQIQMT